MDVPIKDQISQFPAMTFYSYVSKAIILAATSPTPGQN
jgi:hypothetical protein